jgi:hypothetical protein
LPPKPPLNQLVEIIIINAGNGKKVVLQKKHLVI